MRLWMTRSLRARLAVVWLLAAAASVAVAGLLLQLHQQSLTAQAGRAAATLAVACDRIADRYAYFASGWSGAVSQGDATLGRDLRAVVTVALAALPGVEGGVWQDGPGSLAYAFPTYPGTGPKTDLPAAEAPRIAAVNAEAAQSGRPADATAGVAGQTLLLRACPLHGPLTGLTGWAMTRVAEPPGLGPFQQGLGVLGLLVLGLAGWLSWLALSWRRHVARIEAALARGGETLPQVPPTGEAELDRIVAALNRASAQVAAARAEAEAQAARAAAAERLAALGRVAAGVAHEIRNPIAAMRLRAENALAGDAARRGAALEAIVAQIARLDALVSELLAMTQRRVPVPVPVDVPALLRAVAADHAGPPAIRVEAAMPGPCALDPALLRRVLDELLANARRHAPAEGFIALRAVPCAGGVRIVVADTGPGVAPELRETLFEPFVTGRADGSGLGLAVARELAGAMGGRLTLAEPGGAAPGRGAVFALEVPCPAS